MTTDQLRRRVDELGTLAVDLEEWAARLRRQSRRDLDDGILDAILAARPTELPPIDLDAWLASDWPLPEVNAALGL
jgi:hypothetical protein